MGRASARLASRRSGSNIGRSLVADRRSTADLTHVHRYALNLMVGVLVAFTVYVGYLAVTDDGLASAPIRPTGKPLAGGGVAPRLVQTEVSGDVLVKVYESRPDGCDFYEGRAYELLGGSPQAVSWRSTRDRGRCVYRDDATAHQASLTDVNTGDSSERYRAAAAKLESERGLLERPEGIGVEARAQAIDLPDSRRRYVLVWHDGSEFHKLVVRRTITADARTELGQIYTAMRRPEE